MYISLNPFSDNPNYIIECSIYDCGGSNIYYGSTNQFDGGKIVVNSTNTSFCYAEHASGVNLIDAGRGSNALFSSFCNTRASGLIIHVQQCVIAFKYCNVLKNICESYEYGTLTATTAEVVVDNCSFLGNSVPTSDFYTITYESVLDIKNTYCDRNIIQYGEMTTSNIQTTSFIHELLHFSTYFCEAKYPIKENESKKNSRNADNHCDSCSLISSICIHILKI